MRIKQGRKAFRVEEGYVWCDKLGEIHDDTLDPYQYGPPRRPGDDDDRCRPEDHSPVYRMKRRGE